jgi:DNA-binding transcriptional MerR regulator
MESAVRYAIGDLARLAGVSRRTVRYYVQEGLIPAPHGVGRGNHYGPEHLEQILRVKTMQESGRMLDEIRHALARGTARRSKPVRAPEPVLPERSLWRRLTLAPGVELHISNDVRLPPPGPLLELATWCRLHLVPHTEEERKADGA